MLKVAVTVVPLSVPEATPLVADVQVVKIAAEADRAFGDTRLARMNAIALQVVKR